MEGRPEQRCDLGIVIRLESPSRVTTHRAGEALIGQYEHSLHSRGGGWNLWVVGSRFLVR